MKNLKEYCKNFNKEAVKKMSFNEFYKTFKGKLEHDAKAVYEMVSGNKVADQPAKPKGKTTNSNKENTTDKSKETKK